MIKTESLTRLRLLVGAMRPPLVAGARDGELPPLQPGQAIQAGVGRQSNGGHLVEVGGRVFEFRLPDGTRPGDFLRLVYLHSEPRPTFALLRVERAVDAPDATLSGAARLLSSLRQHDPEHEPVPARTQAMAVLPADFPEPLQVAALLREAFSLSGVFYEFHQSQWVMGSRSIAQLEQEPQGRLAPLTPQPSPVQASQHAATADAPIIEAAVELADLLPAPLAATAASDHEVTPARLPAHPDTFPLIRQQLAALETGHVAWRGEIWPGQQMDWDIGEAPDEEHPEVARVWRTSLRLQLPVLGEVEARIDLGAQGTRVRILGDSDEHCALLRANAASLAEAFVAAGLPVAGMEVATRAA